MEILKIFNEEKVSQEEINQLKIRKAVRGLVFDQNNKVAIIFARNNNYYELPGGGVEKGETLEDGVIRECLEEVGCNTKIIKEIGITIEVRKRLEMVNESFGYILEIDGDKGNPSLTDDEIKEGMEVLWVGIEEAIECIKKSDISKDLYDKYVKQRDLTFIEEAKKIYATH